MPTIVCILTFNSMINTWSERGTSSFVGILVLMSSWNFVFSWIWAWKKFYNLGARLVWAWLSQRLTPRLYIFLWHEICSAQIKTKILKNSRFSPAPKHIMLYSSCQVNVKMPLKWQFNCYSQLSWAWKRFITQGQVFVRQGRNYDGKQISRLGRFNMSLNSYYDSCIYFRKLVSG